MSTPAFPPMPSLVGPPSPLDALPGRVHVARADRTSRQRAIAALVAYLEEHRDIRIGQAIVNASGAVDAFNIEDDELASTLEQATRATPTGSDPSGSK